MTTQQQGSNITQIPATTQQQGSGTTQVPATTQQQSGSNNTTQQSATNTTQTPTASQNDSVYDLLKVSKVTKLSKAYAKSTSIKLKWKKQTGVAGYKVYYYNKAKGKYVLCKKVKTNSVVIKKLKKNTTYKFRVKAYKNYNSMVAEGAASKVLKVKTKR